MNTEADRKPLDVAEVRALLVRAVEEKGADYVYPRDSLGACANWRDGEPSCIAGHVYEYAGLAPLLVGFTTNTVVFINLRAHILTTAAEDALQAAQAAQDNGFTWGEALAAFDAAVS